MSPTVTFREGGGRGFLLGLGSRLRPTNGRGIYEEEEAMRTRRDCDFPGGPNRNSLEVWIAHRLGENSGKSAVPPRTHVFLPERGLEDLYITGSADLPRGQKRRPIYFRGVLNSIYFRIEIINRRICCRPVGAERGSSEGRDLST